MINYILFNLIAENAVIEVISLVCDVRVQHVGEIGVQRLFPICNYELEGRQLDFPSRILVITNVRAVMNAALDNVV